MYIQEILENMKDQLIELSQIVVNHLPAILKILVTLVAFYLFAKFIQQLTKNAASRSGAPHSLQVLIANTIKIIILIVGLVVALSMLGLSQTVTTALAGAGVLGIVLGFALQDIAANFISGIVLIFRKPFREGDLVEIENLLGTVEEINLRTTKLKSLTGQMIYIPNQQVFQDHLINYSELHTRRVDITCGVSYVDDLELARKVGIQAIQELPYIDTTEDKKVEFYYNEFADSSINFTLRFWINFEKQPDFLAAQSEAIQQIKKSFDENSIDIPFPVRTLDFGMKGGEKLRDQLSDK